MAKPSLPESIMSQSYGLTGHQITTIEYLGAMLDRAAQSGACAATAWIDNHGCPHLEAEFEPVVIMTDESEA